MDNGGNNQYISLQNKLNGLPSAPSKRCIFKVHEQLRRVSEKAYEPAVVAIGPYHRGKHNLRLMEEQKLWCLRYLLGKYGKSLDDIIKGVGSVEDEARECYAEPFVTNHPRECVDMMVLDGCFIIALFLKFNSAGELRDWDDLISGSLWVANTLMRDVLVFENQLPLCVLYRLSQMLFGNNIPGNPKQHFVKLALRALGHVLWGFSCDELRKQSILEGIVFNREIKHLLGVMHHAFLLSSVLSRDEVAENIDVERQEDQTRKQRRVGCFPHGGNPVEDRRFIPCAKHLQEAGIKFKKAEGCRIRDIHFGNGVLKIPSLRIEDHTESLFRNFIAYEQFGLPRRVVHAPSRPMEVSANFVGEYVSFMDYLIDSESDVALLRQCGVIENLMGDDKVVSDMFNRLGDFLVMERFPSGNYSRIFGEVNRHCSQRWNFHRANLKHNYFNTPWAFVSFLAALLLLSLTLTQTVFTILK